jgi:hypothetical protein
MRLLPLRVWLFAFAGVAAAQNPPGPDVEPFVSLNAPVFALEHVRVIDGTGAADRQGAWLCRRRRSRSRAPGTR